MGKQTLVNPENFTLGEAMIIHASLTESLRQTKANMAPIMEAVGRISYNQLLADTEHAILKISFMVQSAMEANKDVLLQGDDDGRENTGG